MAGVLLGKQVTWAGKRTGEGQREYKIRFKVKALRTDGPFVVLNTPGLPLPGSIWAFDNDIDPWATCLPETDVNQLQEKDGESNFWVVDYNFSTSATKKCHQNPIENPLLEPPKVDGSFVRGKEAALKDRFGERILTSSWEQIRGPQNEWDVSTATVKIEQNVASNFYAITLPARLMNVVNDAPMWGLPKRCVKLSGGGFGWRFYGSCFLYYQRSLEFEINPKTFDRDLLDEGTKCLNGKNIEGNWVVLPIDSFGTMPDPNNPTHFVHYKDRHSENTRVILNGAGVPASQDSSITTCTQCPTGASPKFYVNDFTELPELNDLDVQVTYAFSCRWNTTLANLIFTLEYNAANAQWELTVFDTDTATTLYTFVPDPDGAAFDCTTGGQFVDEVDANSKVTVTGVITEPGKQHIEKYNEGNLFLLGIPIVL